MSSGNKCKNCGSADIEVDSARGDAVCTNCGSVLEDNIIVSEIQFEENALGASSAVGQFVSADSKGGATGYGKFHVGVTTESREVTLRKARGGITHLCHQLSLNNHCIETACNFFKMALMRHLTRGRRSTHVFAACVYITCRTEGTSHLLIDISDVLQICCYELGKTYLKLSQALCINIPSIDPCLYIMRFASKLEFGEKTHEVSMTAQRLVQRMKKDSIHSGRRPSGLCGAALLLAARMHEFCRTPFDVVKIVKIHETTLRKRLLEFGDTPSSALTLEEFMSVDLEAEQDPPAFKAARKKDKERLQKLAESEPEFTALQMEIDAQLEKEIKKNRKRGYKNQGDEELERTETVEFIKESTVNLLNEVIEKNADNSGAITQKQCGIRPDIASMCIPATLTNEAELTTEASANNGTANGELDLEGLDDDELDSYIMTEDEANFKDRLWNRVNADYLQIVKIKEERLAKEREEGKPEKKKRKVTRKKNIGPSNTPGEAIEKMLQEKKISKKINYDILKTLTAPKIEIEPTEEDDKPQEEAPKSFDDALFMNKSTMSKTQRRSEKSLLNLNLGGYRRPRKTPMGLPTVDDSKPESTQPDQGAPFQEEFDEADADGDLEQEPEPEPEPEHSSLADMLNNGDEEEEDVYYGYEEEY